MLRSIFLALLFPVFVFGQTFTKTERLEDFDQLVSWIQDDYGPLQHKRETLGLNFEHITEIYRHDVEATESDQEFRSLLLRYVGEFRDAHFALRYPSKVTSTLGFTTDLVDGKVVIDSIDRNILSKSLFPFKRGDEVISIDGELVLEKANELSRYFGVSFDRTGLRLGVYVLAMRPGNRLPTPRGETKWVIKSRRSQKVKEVILNWRSSRDQQEKRPALNPPTPVGLSDMCSEISRIKRPKDAIAIEGLPFTAFSFLTEKGRIGFVRLPHFYPFNEAGEEIAQERFDQYEQVIAEFEKTTVGLIVDQDFNCGGSIVYLNKLFSLFADKPFEPTKFAFRASHDQILGLSRQLNQFTPKDDGYDEFKEVVEEIRNALMAGEEMTRPLPLKGFMEVRLSLPGGNQILPNPIRYSKPVVLLINEMSGSGGDMFPSLMQDYGRAKLLGTRTMGAGGHLWADPPLTLKNSGGLVALTRSMIYRPNGQPIENLGVEPDVQYEITMDDFLNGYRNYLNLAVKEVLSQL